MHLLDDPLRTLPSVGREGPAPTRRTLLRASATAAWAAPLVTVAAAAPASAATSGGSARLVVDSARFWVMDWSWYDGTFGIVPQIVLTNPSSDPTGGVTLTLIFATADFTGSSPNTDPPDMGFTNLALITGSDWEGDVPPPQAGDTDVRFQLVSDAGLSGNQTVTVGSFEPSSNPGSLTFANDPTVQTIPFLVEATGPGFVATTSDLVRVQPPSD